MRAGVEQHAHDPHSSDRIDRLAISVVSRQDGRMNDAGSAPPWEAGAGKGESHGILQL